MRHALILSACVAVALVAVYLAGCWPSVNLGDCFNGTTNVQLIASPTVVTAWRTAAWFKGDQNYSAGELYQKGETPVVVSANLATELSRLLLNKRSYGFHPFTSKDSICMPCVGITFSNDTRGLDVFISFADNSLCVKGDQLDALGHPQFVGADFDPSRAQLVRLVKGIFPGDQRIQAMSETRVNGALWPEPSARRQ
jgi:hypothetical protein